MKGYRHLRQASLLALLGVSLLLPGCASINRMGANTGNRFAENHIIPAILTDDDAQMACINGQALAPVIYATGAPGLGADNDQLTVLLYSVAANCAEQSELESELRFMRASKENQVDEAADARITQKDWAEVASRRQYHAYQAFEHYYENKYDIKIGEKCPKFKDNEFDQLVFMMGAISGVEAVVNDINSQSAVGVPKDIGAKVERAMTCLNNDKWWGVPNGVRAAIWNLLPGAGAGNDPWATLKQSAQIGQAKGVRLSFALYVMSAYAKGDDAHLRDALKMYAATLDDSSGFVVNPKYRMLDKFGQIVVMGVSHRYWTQHTGSRTPIGSVGHFWDEKAGGDAGGVQVDDLIQ